MRLNRRPIELLLFLNLVGIVLPERIAAATTPMQFIKRSGTSTEMIIEVTSPSGRFKIRQTANRTDYKMSAISITDSSGRVIATIPGEKDQLSSIAWSPDEHFAVALIGSERRLTKYANTSYNQLDAIDLTSGKVVDLTGSAEAHFKKYFQPLFSALEAGGRHPEPGFAAYTQSSFQDITPRGVILSASTLGYNCIYLVDPNTGKIVDKNLLPLGSNPSKLPSGDLEIVHRSDLIGEGDIAEQHEVFAATGKRKWIDLYYQLKFGQPLKLARRAVTGENGVQLVIFK